MHEQVYSWLLLLYPENFRRDYADEALLLFRDRLRDEQGFIGRLRLWLDIVEDLGTSLWSEHRAAFAGSLSPAQDADETVPSLYLIRNGVPFRHVLLGAFGSISVYYAVAFVLLGGGIALAPPWIAGSGARVSPRQAQSPQLPLLPQAAPVSIQGTVRVADTGEPIAGAWIAVNRAESAGTQGAGTPIAIPDGETDADGQFQIRDLAPGSYRVIAMASGYVRQDSPEFIVEAGQPRTLVISMVPAGSVSGRVQDTSGQSLAGINVTLMRRAYSSSGDPTLRRVTATRTNDLGEYRFYWVTPGRYVVAAEGASGPAGLVLDSVSGFDLSASRGINEVVGNYPRQFFPGFPEEQKASTVEVQRRADIRGIDFTLTQATGFFRIRGRVVDALTGEPPAQMSITFMGGTRYFQNARTGAFEYTNIASGTYVLSATESASSAITNILNPDSSLRRGTATVVVHDSDVEDIVVALWPPRLTRGEVRVEGTIEPPSLNRLRFNLVPQQKASGSSIAVSTNADGTFAYGSNGDDLFRVSMPNLPTGFYLKEARLDGTDILNDFGRIAGERLELLISSKTGAISGTATDESGNLYPGVQVVLVPSQRNRTDLFKRAVSDALGRFNISGIPPGEYRAFAWAGLEDYGYFDPAVLDTYESRGQVIQAGESSLQTLELKVIGVLP